jgi:glyoxylase-like metal-dependent hydrolase (beta-lactamase superfamily II)
VAHERFSDRGLRFPFADAPPGMWSRPARDAGTRRTVVETFVHDRTSCISYLVYDDATRVGVVIDPVSEPDPLERRFGPNTTMTAAIEALDIDLQFALETRVHRGHFSAASFFRNRFGAAIVISAEVSGLQRSLAGLFAGSGFVPDGEPFDVLVRDGDVLQAGPLRIEIVAPPGPPAATVAYRIRDALFGDGARQRPVRIDSRRRRTAILRWNLCAGYPPGAASPVA